MSQLPSPVDDVVKFRRKVNFASMQLTFVKIVDFIAVFSLGYECDSHPFAQASNESWKTWKVLEFYFAFFQEWKK